MACGKTLQCQIRKLATAQTATEQNSQDRSITLPRKGLSIGHLPERRRLARCKSVAQTRAQLADTSNALDAGGQFRAQQSRVSRLVS